MSFLEVEKEGSSWKGRMYAVLWRERKKAFLGGGEFLSSSRGLGKTMQLVRVRKKAVLSGEK